MYKLISSIRHNDEVVVQSWGHKVVVNKEEIVIVDWLAHGSIKICFASKILLNDDEDLLLVVLLELVLIKGSLVEGLHSIGVKLEKQLNDLLHSKRAPIGAAAEDVWPAGFHTLRTKTTAL